MILTKDTEYPSDYPVEQWSNEKYTFYWSGFLYWPNIASGEPSLDKFSSEIESSDLSEASRFLRGTYWIAIRSHQSNELWSFTDYSGMFQAFYSPKAVSPDYRSLLGRTDERKLSSFSLLSFLNLGHIYFDQSFISSIRKMPGQKIVKLSSGLSTELISRKPPPFSFSGDAFQDFIHFFSEAAPALKSQNVITDLTGGSDSRLVAALMKYLDIPFSATVFGYKTDEDVELSTRVARQLNCDLNVIEPDSTLNSDRIRELYNLSDGLCDMLSLAGLQQAAEAKKKAGGTLSVNGGGGALYKDFWWLQDFPFYRRKKPNLSKLYAWRWNHHSFPSDLLSGSPELKQEQFQQRFIEKLTPYDAGLNTKTYDTIFMRVKMHEVVGRSNASEHHILPAYSPLLEYIPAKIGFNALRLQRWYNYLERTMVSRLAPVVSMVPTTNGGNTLSDKPLQLIKDFPGYVWNKSTRLLYKITDRESSPKHNQLTSLGRNLKKNSSFEEIVTFLRIEDLITEKITPKQIPDELAGRVYTTGRIIREIRNTSR